MSDQKPDNDQPQRTSGGLKALALAGIAAVALAAVLYGMSGQGGKKSSTACAASSAAAQKIAPLAKGQVAALNVPKSPRMATDIAFNGPGGEKLKLTDFRGKTVLLNLWATWCVPCRVEMPALDRLQGELGGKDFEVVAVNIDTARLERRKAFLDSVGVNRLAFYTDAKAETFQTLKQAGKVVGLPTTILIDNAGCELGVMAGPAEWDGPEALALLRAAMSAQKP
jgi:thiol-disulfide isomerase/thioredoxin